MSSTCEAVSAEAFGMSTPLSGDQMPRSLAEARLTTVSAAFDLARSGRRLSEHRPQRWGASGLDDVNDIESVPRIEVSVARVGCFEVGRESVAVTGRRRISEEC